MDPDRPVIRALVGYFSPAFGLLTVPRIVTLEEAADYARVKDWIVLVDPRDERDLAMHERLERAIAKQAKPKWLERS